MAQFFLKLKYDHFSKTTLDLESTRRDLQVAQGAAALSWGDSFVNLHSMVVGHEANT